jgi:glycosyltransferase involved in cell wall biosynthesis
MSAVTKMPDRITSHMKIGIYLGCSSDNPENIEKQLIAWGKYLNGHDIELFGSADFLDSLKEYYTYIRTKGGRSNHPSHKLILAFKQTCEYIDRRSPDTIIQIWDYPTHAPGVSIASKIKKTPSIVRYSGDHFSEYKFFEGVKKCLAFGLNNIVGYIPLVFADGVITLGPYGKREVTRRQFKRNYIEIIPPATGMEERFSPPSNKTRVQSNLGLPTNKQIVLYVGRITRRKGIPFLQNVIDEFHEDDNIVFVLVGKGECRSELKEMYSSELVQLPGYIAYSKIHQYFQSADVYVHPSKYEGIPQTILEALNCNVPIIAREAGDISYILDHTVRSPKQMGDIISAKSYNLQWKNKSEFTEEKQSERLNRLLEKVKNKNVS